MKTQNQELLESILNRTFFSAWRKQKYLKKPDLYSNYSELELQISTHCDQNCSYCYYARYGKDLYPPETQTFSNILTNLVLILEWLQEHKLYPKISLFSGELFSRPVGFIVLDSLLNWYILNRVRSDIIIPTNFSFILDKVKQQKVENLLEKAKYNKINVFLSASVDGKYCDINRPFRKDIQRTDQYYDDLFQFCKKWNFSFHPMIYSKHIEKWKDNFLWFQEMFQKHNIDWKSLYLLEVRNQEWTIEQLKELYKFIRFIINWSYKESGLPKEEFPQFAFRNRLFNLFSIFSKTGRGIGCSIQSTMQLRLGDLTTTLCHRNSYKELNLFKFVVENNKITGVEDINLPLLISMYSSKTTNFPYCETCTIKDLCLGQCLGAMYEINKSNFVPIPTVCLLEHTKVAAILDELIDLDLFRFFYEEAISKRESLKIYHKLWGAKHESIS